MITDKEYDGFVDDLRAIVPSKTLEMDGFLLLRVQEMIIYH